MKILYDLIDIALLRYKPLTEYRYPLWQIVLLMLALGLAKSPLVQGLQLDLVGRTLFLALMNLAMYAVAARFFRYWLCLRVGPERQPLSPWNGEGSLFAFFVLAQGVEFLAPAALWLDMNSAVFLILLLNVWWVTVVMRGLRLTTGASFGVIIAGVVLLIPMLMLVGMVGLQIALGAGWLDLEALQAAAGSAPAASGAVATPVR